MNALIFGRRRQGKSTLSFFLARRRHQTVIVFDPNAQFDGRMVVYNLEDVREWIDQGGRGEIIFRPTPGMIEEDFETLVEVLWNYGNYALIVDEASCVQNAHSIAPSLERLMRQAPRDGARNRSGAIVDVTVIQTLHRPADANTICRALATDAFIFQTQLARDLDTVENQWGAEVRAHLSTLARWHCVHIWSDLDGSQRYSIWRDPSKWYVAIGSSGPGGRPGDAGAASNRTDLDLGAAPTGSHESAGAGDGEPIRGADQQPATGPD